MPPIHDKGQTCRNLKFMIENEPQLDCCIKKWIVNRIVDPEEERRITDILERHKLDYLRIPFDLKEYHACVNLPWKYRVPIVNMIKNLESKMSGAIIFLKKLRFLCFRQKRHKKILYAMNNNGSRNVAIDDGKKIGDWILPFDGNCCFNSDGWQGVLHTLLHQESFDKYIGVPMLRLTDNSEYFGFNPEGKVVYEPQIVFGKSTSLKFNELFRYGSHSKVELIQRIKYNGHGDLWTQNCGFVIRLNCGSGVVMDRGKWKKRYVLRERGINAFLRQIDRLDK
ncbi:MAG: hypothetical protein GXP53_09265 [Deltaproteobacteria bacterium]|nr:hypothetical protein [Deltaproteobacteria bacterium]